MKKNVYMSPATKYVGAETESLMATSVEFYLPSEGQDGVILEGKKVTVWGDDEEEI